MSPIVPARFRSPLTTPRFPAPTASEYSPYHGGAYDYLTWQAQAAAPTPAALQDRNADPQGYYITLTITLPEDIYTTTILLGDNFPTTSATDPVQQSAGTASLSPAAVQNADSNSGTVAGIIIGVLGGLAVLAGVFYVWVLRARQYQASSKFSTTTSTSTRRTKKRKRRRRRKKKKGKATLFTFNIKWMNSKKRRKSRRSSTSTAGKLISREQAGD